ADDQQKTVENKQKGPFALDQVEEIVGQHVGQILVGENPRIDRAGRDQQHHDRVGDAAVPNDAGQFGNLDFPVDEDRQDQRIDGGRGTGFGRGEYSRDDAAEDDHHREHAGGAVDDAADLLAPLQLRQDLLVIERAVHE